MKEIVCDDDASGKLARTETLLNAAEGIPKIDVLANLDCLYRLHYFPSRGAVIFNKCSTLVFNPIQRCNLLWTFVICSPVNFIIVTSSCLYTTSPMPSNVTPCSQL